MGGGAKFKTLNSEPWAPEHSALDSATWIEVMALIQKINNEGKTILVVTHEHDIAKMCKRIVHLRDGVIVEDKKIKQNILKNV